MVKIQRTRRHGACNDCGKLMGPDTPIWDVKVSTTGQGWMTVMLCRECMLSLHTALAIAATQH